MRIVRSRALGTTCSALGVALAVAAIASVQNGVGIAAGQESTPGASRTAGARKWTPTRTSDGKPDLQGIWNFATLTPMERPTDLAGKDVLTEEEARNLEERAAENRVDRPPRPGDTGAYNLFWIESGTRVVGTRRTSLVVDPPDGKIPPLTPDAQKRQAARTEGMRRPAAGPEDRALAERCILGFNSGPPMVPGGYNRNVHLFQTRDHVVLLNEMVHNSRVVPLDGRPLTNVRQWVGESRGHWEGDTLVVETVNFSDKSNFRGAGAGLRLTERFTRVDGETLMYEFTVNDPATWTRPWTAAIPMTKSPVLMYEYACHEGNYGMEGILAGARADEAAASVARK